MSANNNSFFYRKQNNDICDVCNYIFFHIYFLQCTLFIFCLENSLDKQLKKFQLALYHHYIDKNSPLYCPEEMKSFAQTHCPGLWDNLLSAITNDRAPLTGDRTDLQQKRMVALLHILAYFRYNNYLFHRVMGYIQHSLYLDIKTIQTVHNEMKLMAFPFLFQLSENK